MGKLLGHLAGIATHTENVALRLVIRRLIDAMKHHNFMAPAIQETPQSTFVSWMFHSRLHHDVSQTRSSDACVIRECMAVFDGTQRSPRPPFALQRNDIVLIRANGANPKLLVMAAKTGAIKIWEIVWEELRGRGRLRQVRHEDNQRPYVLRSFARPMVALVPNLRCAQ